MFDATDPMPVLQRSRGAAHVVLGPRGLADLAQGGSAKAMLPRITAGLPQIVFLNTSGGLASGDRLSFAVTLRPGTRALATTQTAERAYARVIEHDRKFDLIKVNPLVTWAHDDVWGHLYAHDVPFNPLHEQGYPSIGCHPCTAAVEAGEDARAGRWRGKPKKECGLHVIQPERKATDAA